jgi:hypothetical protein
MKTKVIWFRHNHENRNDLLRFGLMRMHYNGDISYTELPFSEAGKYGFSQTITSYHDLRHLSFLLIKQSATSIKCMVDNEDSFALFSPLIKEVDICFCAGYNSDLFEEKQFVKTYSWQNETDILWYKSTLEKKINEFGDHFHKIKKFIPIAPNLSHHVELTNFVRKFRNLEHRINRIVGLGNNFSDGYKGFEIRYAYLNELRKTDLRYDITLNDSLWGWPQHRINLHYQLQLLHRKGYKIHSILKWTDPVQHDGSYLMKLEKSNFPVQTNHIGHSYEEMLAQSKLAAFACGFHWGWRNIMMFALMTGIPVITDRLLTEAYFDMNEFHIFQQEDHSWSSIESTLNNINEEKWNDIKKHNQYTYDKYMTPEVVGQYFMKTLSL